MYSPLKGESIFNQYLERGFKKSKHEDKKQNFNIVASVFAKICEEDEKEEYLATARNIYTLYVGGMGAKNKNFYYNLVCDYGYADIAVEIQNLYLAGKKDDASKLFPDELIDDLTLVGTKHEIEKKYESWKTSNVTELSLSYPIDIKTIQFIKSLN